MEDIKKYAPKSGRMIKEDGEVLNIANVLEAIAASQGAEVQTNKTHYKLKADAFPTTNILEKDLCVEIGSAGVEKVYIYLQGQWREM